MVREWDWLKLDCLILWNWMIESPETGWFWYEPYADDWMVRILALLAVSALVVCSAFALRGAHNRASCDTHPCWEQVSETSTLLADWGSSEGRGP